MYYKVLAGVVVAVLLVLGLMLPVGNKTVVQRVSDNLGAQNSPDLFIGGVRIFTAKTTPIQSTSTVICSLQSPSSTSTLDVGSVQLTTATSGASSLSVSKSSLPYTVDTAQIIATTSVASGGYANIQMASSTWNSEALGDLVFPPNNYVVVAQQGAGILNQSGSCQAMWVLHN